MRKAARKQLHACMEVPPGFDAEADGRGLCGASIARSGVGTVSSIVLFVLRPGGALVPDLH